MCVVKCMFRYNDFFSKTLSNNQQNLLFYICIHRWCVYFFTVIIALCPQFDINYRLLGISPQTKQSMQYVMGIFALQKAGSITRITMGVERIVQISSFMDTQMIMRLLGLLCSRLPGRNVIYNMLLFNRVWCHPLGYFSQVLDGAKTFISIANLGNILFL